MLADPDADYISANYIDVSAWTPAPSAYLSLSPPGPSPDRAMRGYPWQKHRLYNLRFHSRNWQGKWRQQLA